MTFEKIIAINCPNKQCGDGTSIYFIHNDNNKIDSSIECESAQRKEPILYLIVILACCDSARQRELYIYIDLDEV